jgi:hypothetical protein
VQDTILNFSQKELEILQDTDFFLYKHSVTRKIMDLLGHLERELKPLMNESGPVIGGIDTASGKIFRGENYASFPYIMLDCPRLFHADSVFAFRSMLWWGHEFSFTLHLQGKALDLLREKLKLNWDLLKGQGVYFCINENPWEYHFKESNYILVDQSFEKSREELLTKPFIKLSRKISLSQYSEAVNYGKSTFQLFLKSLK